MDELLAASAAALERPIFVIHWGPHIPMLISRLAGEDVIYFSHSTGWGLTIPSSIPIFCVSRNTLAYWGRHAANSLLRYVPNLVENQLGSADWGKRVIDVLVQKRKSSDYLLNELVPALRPFCKVKLQEGWVDDLGELFLQSKIFLYDSTQHWIKIGASEGFGLPPIEALASGCIIFTSVNDALADFLDPGVNCHKIRTYSVEYDVAMILKSLETGLPRMDPTSFMQQLRTNSIVNKLMAAIEDAEQFFVLSKGRGSIITDPASYAPSPLKRSLANRLLGWAARV